jgi:hypothetical protein
MSESKGPTFTVLSPAEIKGIFDEKKAVEKSPYGRAGFVNFVHTAQILSGRRPSASSAADGYAWNYVTKSGRVPEATVKALISASDKKFSQEARQARLAVLSANTDILDLLRRAYAWGGTAEYREKQSELREVANNCVGKIGKAACDSTLTASGKKGCRFSPKTNKCRARYGLADQVGGVSRRLSVCATGKGQPKKTRAECAPLVAEGLCRYTDASGCRKVGVARDDEPVDLKKRVPRTPWAADVNVKDATEVKALLDRLRALNAGLAYDGMDDEENGVDGGSDDEYDGDGGDSDQYSELQEALAALKARSSPKSSAGSYGSPASRARSGFGSPASMARAAMARTPMATTTRHR